MDEITRIAKLYYKACVDFTLFGWKGLGLLIAGCPFLIYSFDVAMNNNLKINSDAFVIIPQMIGLSLWSFAKKFYDKNLIKRLQKVTQTDTTELKTLKTLYLSSLTAPIGESFNAVLKNITELQKVHTKNKSFSLDNFGFHFSGFIYDPDSKNRILSLFIYMIGSIALVTVAKIDNTEYVYEVINQLAIKGVLLFLGWIAFFITFAYIILMLPFMMAYGYLISPIMRHFSNQNFLIGYLLAELSKFAFSDQLLKIHSSKDHGLSLTK